jgi:hypothetical protein
VTHRSPGHAGRRTARSRVALTGHVAAMLPWGPLLAGCLAGVAVTVALRIFAGPIESPADLGAGLRASFVPVAAGLAFLLPDECRQLTGALPARAWLTPVLRLCIAVPVVLATAAVQLQFAARALAVDMPAAGGAPGQLPWVALSAELAAWCSMALALAAAFQRTRWRDLAGFIAAIAALAVVGLLALLPLHLLPATITAMTSAQVEQWASAWRAWAAACVAALLVARWAAGDPWRRVPSPARAR